MTNIAAHFYQGCSKDATVENILTSNIYELIDK